jgi:hypothetical protein
MIKESGKLAIVTTSNLDLLPVTQTVRLIKSGKLMKATSVNDLA